MFYLCPETEKLTEFYKLKNKYGNRTELYSFSLEVIKCTSDPISPTKCKDDTEIGPFLEHVIMTQYYLMESTNFRDKVNLKKSPLKAQIQYYA